MYQHLKDLRESLGMTQAEFGKSVGIAKSTYNNYEKGIREPKSDFWIAVATEYGVTIDYLMGFSNDPHRTSDMQKNASSSQDEALLKLFHQLNEEGKQRLLETADDLVQSRKYIKTNAPELVQKELREVKHGTNG